MDLKKGKSEFQYQQIGEEEIRSEMDSMFPGMSFLSLLTHDHHHHFTPSSSPPPFLLPPTPMASFFNPLQTMEYSQTPFSPSFDSVLPALLSLDPPPPLRPTTSSIGNRRSRAQRQRQSLSDKTRRLQKLLPWDSKMNISTTLHETFLYISFLQAQLSALRSMPTHSSLPYAHPHFLSGTPYGPLASLSRNQLLQALLNSPLSQTLLYSQACCVFSAEQLDFLTKTNFHSTTTPPFSSPPSSSIFHTPDPDF